VIHNSAKIDKNSRVAAIVVDVFGQLVFIIFLLLKN